MPISSKAREILNRKDLIEKRDLWFERMENVFDAKETEWSKKYVYAVNGVSAWGRHDPYTEPELWAEDCLENLAECYEIMENENYFRPLCVEYNIYGVHYIDKI